MDHLSQTHSQIGVPVFLIAQQASLFFVRQAVLKALENFGILEIPLIEPSVRYDAQPLLDCAEALGIVRDYHHGLLHRRPGDFRGPVDEQ